MEFEVSLQDRIRHQGFLIKTLNLIVHILAVDHLLVFVRSDFLAWLQAMLKPQTLKASGETLVVKMDRKYKQQAH